MGVFEGSGKIRIHDGGGIEYSLDGGATWTVVSGGGGFGSNVTIQQPNSASALVNTLQLLNQYLVNTAGSETADWDITVPVGGVQTTLRLGRANLAGPAAVTTASATPTVAFPPRASALQITLGQLATKLIVTGLNLAADLGYDIVYSIPSNPAAEIDLSLNDSSIAGQLKGYALGAGLSPFTLTNLWMCDAGKSPVDGFLELRDRGSGVAKGYRVEVWDSSLNQKYTGHSTLTANVTSVSMSGVPSGTVITIFKLLPSIA